MNSEQIQNALELKGFSFGLIAEQLNVNKTAVSTVASRKSTSKRIALALAAAIEEPVQSVFPDKPQYHAHGERLSGEFRETKKAELKALLVSAQIA